MIVLAVETTIIIAAVVALLIGGGLGVIITRSALRKILLAKTELDIKELSEKAEVERKEKLLEAKEKFMQMKADHEKKCEDRKREIQRLESDLKNRQNQLNQRNEELQKNWAKRNDELQQEAVELKNREQELDQRHENLSKRQAELDRTQEEQTKLLEKISNLSSEEAKEQLKEIMRDEATAEAMILSKEIIEEAKMSANQTAKKIVLETIQRTAAEHAIENTVSVFNIENDEMKGRIIGREGRNIRALESLTGVEIIIDDSPDAILLSGFDPIRREIARLSLKKLVTDGRIHPARIEEVVRKVEKQVEQEIIETGKRTVIDMGIHNVAPELIKMIGRMKYRSSYGQNLLQHSTEVANLCATMAAELGLNPKAAKRAGLLHDIGKVAENDEELPHALLGMKTAERYKEKPEICNAIGAHHDEIEMETLIAPIVQVCDAISGARPGARREVVEAYIQRLNKLEEMALAFPGVVKTYAIQAGRELRVIVAADKVSDTEADRIAYDLSRQIQTEMTYPGQIKITVIRETRSISFAK